MKDDVSEKKYEKTNNSKYHEKYNNNKYNNKILVRTLVVKRVRAWRYTGCNWKGSTKDVSASVVRNNFRRCDISDYEKGKNKDEKVNKERNEERKTEKLQERKRKESISEEIFL